MELKHDVLTTLERMGKTADEVAASVRARGVQGVQGVRNAVRVLNPVVRYVQNTLRNDQLDLDLMSGRTISLNSASRKEEIAIPEQVKQFLDAFNRGAYPDLELPPDKS